MTDNKFMRFIRCFTAAGRGLGLAVLTERNVRIHVTAVFYVCFFGIIGRLDGTGWACVYLCFGLVLGAELVNTAVERLCDLNDRERNGRIKDIKDISAGAVLVCAAVSVAVAAVLFLDERIMNNIADFMSNTGWMLGFIASIPVTAIFVIIEWRKK